MYALRCHYIDNESTVPPSLKTFFFHVFSPPLMWMDTERGGSKRMLQL